MTRITAVAAFQNGCKMFRYLFVETQKQVHLLISRKKGDVTEQQSQHGRAAQVGGYSIQYKGLDFMTVRGSGHEVIQPGQRFQTQAFKLISPM